MPRRRRLGRRATRRVTIDKRDRVQKVESSTVSATRSVTGAALHETLPEASTVVGDVCGAPHQPETTQGVAHEVPGIRGRLEVPGALPAAVHEDVGVRRPIVEVLDHDAKALAVSRVVELHAFGRAGRDLLIVVVGRAGVRAAPDAQEAFERGRVAGAQLRVRVAPVDARASVAQLRHRVRGVAGRAVQAVDDAGEPGVNQGARS